MSTWGGGGGMESRGRYRAAQKEKGPEEGCKLQG